MGLCCHSPALLEHHAAHHMGRPRSSWRPAPSRQLCSVGTHTAISPPLYLHPPATQQLQVYRQDLVYHITFANAKDVPNTSKLVASARTHGYVGPYQVFAVAGHVRAVVPAVFEQGPAVGDCLSHCKFSPSFLPARGP